MVEEKRIKVLLFGVLFLDQFFISLYLDEHDVYICVWKLEWGVMDLTFSACFLTLVLRVLNGGQQHFEICFKYIVHYK